MKKVKETGKKQTIKIFMQMFAILMLLPTIMINAQSVKIPDDWSDGYAYVNGIRIHYYHAKPAQGKPAMVMVHGVTDIGLSWTTLTLKLQGSYDIFMLDARGHGLSDPFTSTDNGETLIKDIVDFVHVMKILFITISRYCVHSPMTINTKLGISHPFRYFPVLR